MGHGPLRDRDSQGIQHSQRPERLSKRSGEPEVYFGFVVEPDTAEFGDGGGGERLAGLKVRGRKPIWVLIKYRD